MAPTLRRLLLAAISLFWLIVTSEEAPPPHPNRPLSTLSPYIPVPPPPPRYRPAQNSHLFELNYTSPKVAEPTPTPLYYPKTPPYLVIIVDDIAFRWEAERLRQLGLPLVPSFLPPTPRHPETPKLARQFKFYMVHLPLEAKGYRTPEEGTLKVETPYLQIRERIHQLKLLFPRAHFYNNHTGSSFTANLPAMERLFRGLKFYGLGFIDSRTTPATKGELAAKKYPIPFYSRRIFLDNVRDVGEILKNYQRALKIASREGYAIVICHPTKATFYFFQKYRNYILKTARLIPPEQLPRLFPPR